MLEAGSTGQPPTGKPAFQRYRLVRRIARGGMAEVYLAVLRGAAGFERRVALKKILPVYAGMEEFAKLFRDEARISAALNHSGIVQVYDFGTHRGDYWIAMEFVDGPDLEEVLDRCRRRGIHPPVDVVIHLGHRLASALEYAHGVKEPLGGRMDLIHRDVSPPNILLSVQGEVKLTDFGVAKAAVRDSATRPGVLRGKYAYMSPEQVQHRPIDHRSDLFGLGILLYETLTGVNPFEGSTDYQTIESVGRAEVEPAGFLRPDTPAELDRILLGLLEPDPELRYQTGGEFRRDLAGLMIERPQADEPSTLVEFLRELFPERAPRGQEGRPATPGPPVWESLAHLLTAHDVDVPARFPEGPGEGVRLEERPPLRDSLWVSAPVSGESWGAITTADTASGVEPEPRLAVPPQPARAPSDDWDDVSRNEWSVEGEDPEEALQPTQPLATSPLRLSLEDATLPPLPWADAPPDEAPAEREFDDDETLEDTDPNLRPVSIEPPVGGEPASHHAPAHWDVAPEWEGKGALSRAADPQPPRRPESSEWADEPAPFSIRTALPVPAAPPPSADALFDHVAVQAPRNDMGLPHLNEWDLGENAFDPAGVTPPDEEVTVRPGDGPEPEPPDRPGGGARAEAAPDDSAPESAPPKPHPKPHPKPAGPKPKAPEPPVAADVPEPETLSIMPTAVGRQAKLPDGPIKPTVVNEVGRPAVSRRPGLESVRVGVQPGHRRRGRAAASEDGSPAPVRSRSVDLGISKSLPDIPPEETEAQRAMELARGRPLSRTILAVGAAILFLLPMGLLLGARQLERIQRDREVPVMALRPTADFRAVEVVEALPLLEPMAPIRAPDL